MSGIFVPVDLDQVLDDFEEQEKNNHESSPQSRPNSLDLPCNLQDGQLKTLSINSSEPRTYSFNSPLDAMLKEHSNSYQKPGKSLAQELADLNFGKSKNDDDDDDCDDDIDAESDASSTTAVIAAAEKITRENDFSAKSFSFGTSNVASSDGYNNDFIGITRNIMNENDPKYQSNENSHSVNAEMDDETDFLSLLNSVVEENPFNLEAKSSNSTLKDSISTELSTEFQSFSLAENSSSIDNESHCTDDKSDYPGVMETNSHSLENNIDVEKTISQDSAENIDVKTFIDSQPRNEDVASSIRSEALESSNLFPKEIENGETHAVVNSFETQQFIQDTVFNDDIDSSHQVQNYDTRTNSDEHPEQVVGDIVPSSFGTQEESIGTVACADSSLYDSTLASQHLSGVNVEGVVSHDNDQSSSHNEVIADDNSADSLCGSDSSDTGHNQDSSALVPDDDRDLCSSPARTLSPEPELNEAMTAVHISSGDPEMGFVPPIWVPDEVATHCMTCGLKFSMIKRKHHCRACGKVVCGSCSDNLAPLAYLDYAPARVCDVCYEVLLKDQNKSIVESDIDRSPTSPVSIVGEELDRIHRKPPMFEILHRFKSGSKRNYRKSKIITNRPSVRTEVVGHDSDSQMSGYLKFKRTNKHGWKRLWFVLKGNVLYTYKASEDIVAQETIPILGYVVQEATRTEGDEIQFQLKHAGLPPISFKTETESSAFRWTQQLRKATTL